MNGSAEKDTQAGGVISISSAGSLSRNSSLASKGERSHASRSSALSKRSGMRGCTAATLPWALRFNQLKVQASEAAPRLVAHPLDAGTQDPLLALALNGLGDAEFAITHWAALAHLSERQLRRRVGELTGQSPQTWLREQRLLRVRYLLRSGACKTLAEAAGSAKERP